MASVRLVKQKARIHTNMMIMGVFAVMAVVQAMRGRKAREEGRSVVGMNLDWHKKFNETGVIGNIRDDQHAHHPDVDVEPKRKT